MYYIIDFDSSRPLRVAPFTVYPITTRERAMNMVKCAIERLEQPEKARTAFAEVIKDDEIYFRVGNCGWYTSIEGPKDPTDNIGVPVSSDDAEALHMWRGVQTDQIVMDE